MLLKNDLVIRLELVKTDKTLNGASDINNSIFLSKLPGVMNRDQVAEVAVGFSVGTTQNLIETQR